MRKFVLFISLVLGLTLSVEARDVYTLNDGWRFFFQNDNSSDKARNVTLPHTWNATSATEQGGYTQTTAKYLRTLQVPSEWSGKRLFVRFHGVQSVADLFVNGSHIGEHRGGHTAFTFEITDKVNFGSKNSLLVTVSNAYHNDLFPLSSEATLYGGIYRDVELIVTDRTTIAPDYYGTDALFVHQSEVTAERVSGTVQVMVSGKKDSTCALSVELVAPDGYVSTEKHLKAKIDGKLLTIPFSLESPVLWSQNNPNLYTVRASVGDEVVEVKTGFRRIEITADKKAQINSRRVYIHGVTLYHDRWPVGTALSAEDYAADLRLIEEMGANAIRSATGPHAQSLYDECDRRGILVWIDSPLVRAPFMGDMAYYPTPRLEENGVEQLKEIIYQNINHPSVIMWGIFSQLRGSAKAQLDYVKKLNTLAKKCDPSRPTVACSNSDGEINFVTDLIVWRQSVGWSRGSTTDLEVWQGALKKSWGHLAQAVCYGESGVRGLYASDMPMAERAKQHLVPESVQTRFHEQYARFVNEELFWGVWLNTMFDFGAVRHTSGVCNTGLVTIDHATRKDAFYLYKVLWNYGANTLHIVGKHCASRDSEEQTFTVYSSGERPQLTINGDEVKLSQHGRGVYRSEKIRLSGINVVKATAGGMSDSMELSVGDFVRRK